MVLYMAVKTAFSFLQAEKNEKKDAAGRWGGGMMAGRWSQGEGWRRRGGEEGGGMAGGVPAVLVVCRGATTIKVYLCTAFEVVRDGREGYFCTVATLHRRRRWIRSRRR